MPSMGKCLWLLRLRSRCHDEYASTGHVFLSSLWMWTGSCRVLGHQAQPQVFSASSALFRDSRTPPERSKEFARIDFGSIDAHRSSNQFASKGIAQQSVNHACFSRIARTPLLLPRSWHFHQRFQIRTPAAQWTTPSGDAGHHRSRHRQCVW